MKALNNKGNSLQSLADLQAALSQHGLAQASYAASIAAYDAALERAPNYVYALNNKGLSLQRLAILQAALSQHGLAQATYGESIAAFDAALERAPDYVKALNNKGNSLQRLADLLVQQEQIESAIACFGMTLASWHRALEIAPADSRLRERYQTLVSWLQSVCQSLQESISADDEASEDVDRLMAKSQALTLQAKLQMILAQPDAALESYEAAIATYETALAIVPDSVQCLYSIGESYLQLAVLIQEQQPDQAQTDAEKALEYWNTAAELAPDNVALREERDGLLSLLQPDPSTAE
ncbi:tetratricopeptide repeat protein [Oscillatoria sp. CS-180]|uniref:tetratricopeptide repeat protein n=1 Tax=Oscillatoria sp. CS-180 TaxID=3021720 RepID=UPI00232D3539|nr:tetratricopeptide repeat protein [Oscillatoria sp. CS-180]MDB9527943.1 tetratricopeptide repeat protein [Oscillatoria sp. CS-180]